MTKLMQEAVTDVASCGVMNLPTNWIFLMGSLMILAKAAYTASLYAMTPMIQATIKEICGSTRVKQGDYDRKQGSLRIVVRSTRACTHRYSLTQNITVAVERQKRAHLLVTGRYGSIS